MDAVLSAGELVIDEEERALLENMGLEANSPKNSGKSKKNCAQKVPRQKSGKSDDPLTKPLAPDGMLPLTMNMLTCYASLDFTKTFTRLAKCICLNTEILFKDCFEDCFVQ